MEVAACENPIAREIRMNIIGKVTVGAENSRVPNFPRKKASVILYIVCKRLVRTMGHANFKSTLYMGKEKMSTFSFIRLLRVLKGFNNHQLHAIRFEFLIIIS